MTIPFKQGAFRALRSCFSESEIERFLPTYPLTPAWPGLFPGFPGPLQRYSLITPSAPEKPANNVVVYPPSPSGIFSAQKGTRFGQPPPTAPG